MKKIIMGTIALLGLSFILARSVMALSVPFAMTATVPAATAVSITATKVLTPSNTWVPGTVSAFNFDPLTYNSENGIWVPAHYFAVDVGVSGGVGNPNVTVSYGSESSPVGQPKGLGYKATASFIKVTGPTGTQVETPFATHPKKLLKSITSGESITRTEIAGGFLRLYVGIYTGNDTGLNAAGGEPFTNGDLPGSYTGTVTVTAVIP